jgi:hypothetical protein
VAVGRGERVIVDVYSMSKLCVLVEDPDNEDEEGGLVLHQRERQRGRERVVFTFFKLLQQGKCLYSEVPIKLF